MTSEKWVNWPPKLPWTKQHKFIFGKGVLVCVFLYFDGALGVFSIWDGVFVTWNGELGII